MTDEATTLLAEIDAGIAAVRKEYAAACPGKWEYDVLLGDVMVCAPNGLAITRTRDTNQKREIAAHICALHNREAAMIEYHQQTRDRCERTLRDVQDTTPSTEARYMAEAVAQDALEQLRALRDALGGAT